MTTISIFYGELLHKAVPNASSKRQFNLTIQLPARPLKGIFFKFYQVVGSRKVGGEIFFTDMGLDFRPMLRPNGIGRFL